MRLQILSIEASLKTQMVLQADPWDALASYPSLLGELQGNERQWLEKQGRQLPERTLKVGL